METAGVAVTPGLEIRCPRGRGSSSLHPGIKEIKSFKRDQGGTWNAEIARRVPEERPPQGQWVTMVMIGGKKDDAGSAG